MYYLNKITLIHILGGIIVFFFLTTISYLYSLKNNYCVTPNDWKDAATYIADISTLLTAFASIFITYLVYKWGDYAHKSEYYFEKIVEHYLELQKNHDILFSNDNKEIVEPCKLNIKIHVQLLRYYLRRYPDQKYSVKEFDLALNHIWFEPMNNEYYKNLPYEFETFCFYANQDQKRPYKHIKDKKGRIVEVDY